MREKVGKLLEATIAGFLIGMILVHALWFMAILVKMKNAQSKLQSSPTWKIPTKERAPDGGSIPSCLSCLSASESSVSVTGLLLWSVGWLERRGSDDFVDCWDLRCPVSFGALDLHA